VAQFREYYAIVLKELGTAAPPEIIDKLAQNEVLATGQEPFADTRATLEELYREGLKLGIVSNAWPSLERTYRVLGLRDFFQAFIISSKLGVLKPDGRIYQAALREIGCPPEKVLFVDDDPDYVRAAESLGMWGTVISREGRATGESGTITNLNEVKALIWR
jgi:putative hydrolase of the HAD superfamily